MNLPKLNPVMELAIISAIINAVGRSIILTYVDQRTRCIICSGNDPFCPTCHGNPTTDIVATQTVIANIVWKGSDQKVYRPEGQTMEGDCLVDFVISSVGNYTQTDILLKQVTTVTVDNRICVIKRWYYDGSPINRVTLVLQQDDDIGGQRIG